ncbi:MAG: hypothetical protein KJ904_02005 [Alphaproteobacteria bacterium]|nr:hypothetical protein [Alphaproteobacteria bacterium]MBU0798647.1 hypothetical protein [Alphaproteobacteria bacterium]MBU0885910.1 hypothetical protein [Alphaproteobacteria bacterium]MBU1811899.1 hypothetical protein [Alphaproteobacteria bacterium]
MIAAAIASAARGDPPRAETIRRLARDIAADEARYGRCSIGLLQERGWSLDEIAELAEEATAMARTITAARRGITPEGPRP